MKAPKGTQLNWRPSLWHRWLLHRFLVEQGPDCDSDDVVQDAFLIACTRWQTIAYYDNPMTYLYKCHPPVAPGRNAAPERATEVLKAASAAFTADLDRARTTHSK